MTMGSVCIESHETNNIENCTLEQHESRFIICFKCVLADLKRCGSSHWSRRHLDALLIGQPHQVKSVSSSYVATTQFCFDRMLDVRMRQQTVTIAT